MFLIPNIELSVMLGIYVFLIPNIELNVMLGIYVFPIPNIELSVDVRHICVPNSEYRVEC